MDHRPVVDDEQTPGRQRCTTATAAESAASTSAYMLASEIECGSSP
jgi:hypothetical protein